MRRVDEGDVTMVKAMSFSARGNRLADVVEIEPCPFCFAFGFGKSH